MVSYWLPSTSLFFGHLMKPLNPFEPYIQAMTRLVGQAYGEPALLDAAEPLLSELIASDRWLPEAYAVASEKTYQQYWPYCDPLARFSVVSFVWGPGQKTPIHDHKVWGLIGVLRGAERGHHLGHDVLPVSHALPDQVTSRIQMYGADIGRVKCHGFEENSLAEREFDSGYEDYPPLMSSTPASQSSVF